MLILIIRIDSLVVYVVAFGQNGHCQGRLAEHFMQGNVLRRLRGDFYNPFSKPSIARMGLNLCQLHEARHVLHVAGESDATSAAIRPIKKGL
jgi:hypothetical protein